VSAANQRRARGPNPVLKLCIPRSPSYRIDGISLSIALYD
jgi:hypothetical protein